MIGLAMRAAAEADHSGAGCQRAAHPYRRILDDRALPDRHAKAVRGVQVKVGRRLAALDMFVAAVEVFAERVGEPEMLEMAAHPAG